MMPRKPLTPKQKAAIRERQNGKCAICREPLGPHTDYDHEIPLELGGKDDPSNIRALHADPCHREKTKLDAKLIAKSRRIRAKRDGTWRPNRKRISSGGFRSGAIVRKMDGTHRPAGKAKMA